MAVWTETGRSQPASENVDRALAEAEAPRPPASETAGRAAAREPLAPPAAKPTPTTQRPIAPAPRRGPHGWPIPSSISLDPVEARARIPLPEFDALLLEKGRVISGRFPQA